MRLSLRDARTNWPDEAHIVCELRRVDVLVRALTAYAVDVSSEEDPYRGLYINDTEVHQILSEALGPPAWSARVAVHMPSIWQEFDDLRAQNAAYARGLEARPPLELLCDRFGLGTFERDAVLVCLLAEVDARYERLFGYLHDDVTRRLPSVDLVLGILCPQLEDKLTRRKDLSASAPLLSQGILQFVPADAESHGAHRRVPLRVEPRILQFLFGSDRFEPQLADWSRPTSTDAASLDEVTEARLRELHRQGAWAPKQLLMLEGPYGSGRQHAAAYLCRALEIPMIWVDGANLARLSAADVKPILRGAFREARLNDAALYWHGADAWLTQDADGWRASALLEHAQRFNTRLALPVTKGWVPTDVERDIVSWRVRLGTPDAAQRRRVWQRSLAGVDVDPDALTQIAHRFKLTAGQIRDAAAAHDELRPGREGAGQLGFAELQRAANEQSTRGLAALAQRIVPRRGWSDLVLPADALAQLHELCAQVVHRVKVLDEWGFDAKLSGGKGLNILFSGPSGTGKTLSAEVVAGALGFDLFRIDLATVVSKYIGETEKNLARIFDEAERSSAVLLFDEADALFGKRSEIKDSHDRYANIEVAYLLQRMEEHEGVTVLATNAKSNMDIAFARRMAFHVVFPFPDETLRLGLWNQVFPDAVPRSTDLDLEAAARVFPFAGGNIRNVALSAAFLAAARGSVVGPRELAVAAKREFQKLGRACSASSFGVFFPYLEEGDP